MDADLAKTTAGGSAKAGQPLTVHVNGEPRQTHAATLAALLAEAGYGDTRVATALNGNFVAQRARDATPLGHGDEIEIVAPRQGG